MGYPAIYPVHPREKELLGLKTYPGIQEIPVDIDLAISLVPRTEVLQVVRDCAAKGVKGLILFTSGFKEKDDEGGKIEQEIVRAAREGGVRLIGPNANGIYCPRRENLHIPWRFNGRRITHGKRRHRDYLPERLICRLCLPGAGRKEYPVQSRWWVTATKATSARLIFWNIADEDKETRVIAGYLEGIKDGRQFLRTGEENIQTKTDYYLERRTDGIRRKSGFGAYRLAGGLKTGLGGDVQTIRYHRRAQFGRSRRLCRRHSTGCLYPREKGRRYYPAWPAPMSARRITACCWGWKSRNTPKKQIKSCREILPGHRHDRGQPDGYRRRGTGKSRHFTDKQPKYCWKMKMWIC